MSKKYFYQSEYKMHSYPLRLKNMWIINSCKKKSHPIVAINLTKILYLFLSFPWVYRVCNLVLGGEFVTALGLTWKSLPMLSSSLSRWTLVGLMFFLQFIKVINEQPDSFISWGHWFHLWSLSVVSLQKSKCMGLFSDLGGGK